MNLRFSNNSIRTWGLLALLLAVFWGMCSESVFSQYPPYPSQQIPAQQPNRSAAQYRPAAHYIPAPQSRAQIPTQQRPQNPSQVPASRYVQPLPRATAAAHVSPIFTGVSDWDYDPAFEELMPLTAHIFNLSIRQSRLPSNIQNEDTIRQVQLIQQENEFPWLSDREFLQAQMLEEEDPAETEEDPTIGEEPEDRSTTFLRREAVLMKRGDWEVDWGLLFALSEDDRPLLIPSTSGLALTELELERRALIAPFSLRYGLRDKMQLLCSVPVGWSNTRLSYTGFDDFDNIVGIGDVTIGFSSLIHEGKEHKPRVIVTFTSTAPTANASFPGLTTLTNGAALGSGHWGFSVRSVFIQKYDPVVVFYGFGYRQFLEEDFNVAGSPNPILIQPGAEGNYLLGVGFSASNRVNLNASLQGRYLAETRRDGAIIPGSSQQPTNIRLSATLRNPDYVVEPFVQFTPSGSQSTVFGITWTYSHSVSKMSDSDTSDTSDIDEE